MREPRPEEPGRNKERSPGVPAGFEAFFREHYGFVRRAVTRSAGPWCSDLDDLAQEVFLVAMDRLDSLDPGSKPTTWLYGITWRVVSQYRRRRKLRRWFSLDHEDDLAAAPGEEPEERLLGREVRREVYSILEKISEKKRQTLILYELEGFRGEEIAEIMDCKESTVWTRLHYARKEFRALAERRALPGIPLGSAPQRIKGGRE